MGFHVDLDKFNLAEASQDFDRDGYYIFENILSDQDLFHIRTALQPEFDKNLRGRNNFEGHDTNRVYALLAKHPIFSDLILHSLAMHFVDRECGASALLSAALAINLLPGETAQPWHFDDAHIQLPRPRDVTGISTFWAIDPMTDDNGATEILIGSHKWDDSQAPQGQNESDDFVSTTAPTKDGSEGNRHDIVKAIMPAGSLMIAKSTLWHRGGANTSDNPRLLITPQYCKGWVRQLENMLLAVPPEKARDLPKRAQELIGYALHPPFMGYVDGGHPHKILG